MNKLILELYISVISSVLGINLKDIKKVINKGKLKDAGKLEISESIDDVSKKFVEAIDQLCGYTTWRETKTSLIIFNKENKDFSSLVDSIDAVLKTMERCKNLIRLEHNQWQGIFSKELASKDTLTINVMIYDLYIKE